jgi:trehalose synthase-fused probable maltokinase
VNSTGAIEMLSAQGLVSPAQQVLEYITRQRWFGIRPESIRGAELADAFLVGEGDPAVVLVLLDVAVEGGEQVRFHVPLAVRHEQAEKVWEGNVVATGRRDAQDVVVYDAMSDGETAWSYWEAMRQGLRTQSQHGELLARASGIADEPGPERIRPMGREQSNTSVIRGETEVLKCFRRVALGRSPELEMIESLAAVGFANVAAPLGVLEYRSGDTEPSLLAMVQPYLHNGTEGWTLALTSLRDLYSQAEEDDDLSVDALLAAVRGQGSSFEAEARRIGEVTARMHLALSGSELIGDMAPRPATREVVEGWRDGMMEDLHALLAREDAALEPLRARRAEVEAEFAAIMEIKDPGMAIRHHGDYHLGQLLRTDSGWTVLDFEGEPARGASARRAHSSPLRDVAGMLRSFDYAAAVELADWAHPGDPGFERLRAYGDTWAECNRAAFWSAYTRVTSGSPMLPAGYDAVILRRAFELQKAVYEVGYELGHRPDWAAIPLSFLLTEAGS